jgi:hypothetical protein
MDHHPPLAHALPDLTSNSAKVKKKTAARSTRTAVCVCRPQTQTRGSLCAEIHHVNVGTQPDVIGKVPSYVVGIFIDHDLIRIPEPVIAEANVKGRYAEIETPEPESARSASCKPPDVTTAKAACKVAVLPGVVEMVVRIVAAGTVADPMIAFRVNVGCVRMAGLFRVSLLRRCSGAGSAMNGRRTVSGNVTPSDFGASSALLLRKNGSGEKQRKDDREFKYFSHAYLRCQE